MRLEVNDMKMLRWMCGHLKEVHQKQTCERLNKSATSNKEKHRENDDVVRTCQEKGRRKCVKRNGRCTSTSNVTERKTENQVERLL